MSTVEAPDQERPRAKHLPIRHHDEPLVVPARMVNEVLYCERLFYLEWVQGEFADNRFTVEGREVIHRRVDKKRGTPKAAPSAEDEAQPWQATSVWLTSERLGLTGKVDLVEADGSGLVVPVEYKRGRRPRVPEGAWLPERAQLCAQGMLLEEHGYRCEEGWIWFAGSRARVAIPFDEALRDVVRRALDRARHLARAGTLPPPLDDDPRCKGCSLSSICLPDEVHLLRGERSARVRPLHPRQDYRVPLYVHQQGSRVGVKKDRLKVTPRDGEPVEVRVRNTSQVCVFGHVQISTQAIRALLSRHVPVTFFSTGGWYLGRTLGHDTNNAELRAAQYATVGDEARSLAVARVLVGDKIANQRTLLRRNHPDPPAAALKELKFLGRKAQRAETAATLLGLEGAAAHLYFRLLPSMLKKADDAARLAFDFTGRNRRPPKDPVNAMLSLAYALLTKDWALTLQQVGFDPLLGLYHQPRFGKPALALDLMEPFRPLIADSTVLTAINTGAVRPGHFQQTPFGCSLTRAGRSAFIGAYERRLEQKVRHPLFDYRASYRRILELHARLLARHVLGELPAMPSFRTR